MKIQVKIKNQYGRDTIYPVCEKAKIFANLVKQSTLTKEDITLIKALGYEIEVVQDIKRL